jgi:hypothetical protein
VLTFQASSMVFMLAALRFWSIAQAVVTHSLDDAALEAPLKSYASELSRLRQKAARDYGDLVGVVQASRAVPGVITDDIDERLQQLDERGKSLLRLDVADLTSTMTSFVAWAEPVLAEPNALNRLVTEIIDLSIAAAA